VLAGDAFGFLDPIYSTGVLLALKSAELASDGVLAAFKEKDFSAARLGAHGARIVSGIEAFRRLVYAFYTPGFSFANFVSQHPEHREKLIQILLGDVFRGGLDDLFRAMSAMCDFPEAFPLQGASG
jgi:flavin-dependent dehydrogenase